MRDRSGGFVCSDCGRNYKLKSSLRNHQKWECGKEPQFKCPYCSYRAKQKMHMSRHLERMHKELDFSNMRYEMKKSESKDTDRILSPEEDKIMCPKCGKKYPRLQLLTHVQFECGKQAVLQCPLCPRKCKRDDILQSHLRNIHRIN
nr:unnamed protein product [Callosobruchus chinensis]